VLKPITRLPPRRAADLRQSRARVAGRTQKAQRLSCRQARLLAACLSGATVREDGGGQRLAEAGQTGDRFSTAAAVRRCDSLRAQQCRARVYRVIRPAASKARTAHGANLPDRGEACRSASIGAYDQGCRGGVGGKARWINSARLAGSGCAWPPYREARGSSGCGLPHWFPRRITGGVTRHRAGAALPPESRPRPRRVRPGEWASGPRSGLAPKPTAAPWGAGDAVSGKRQFCLNSHGDADRRRLGHPVGLAGRAARQGVGGGEEGGILELLIMQQSMPSPASLPLPARTDRRPGLLGIIIAGKAARRAGS